MTGKHPLAFYWAALFFCCFVLVTTPQFFRGITPLSQSFKHHSIESKSLCLPRNLILRSVRGSKQSQLQAQPSWCASASVHSLIPLQDISHLSHSWNRLDIVWHCVTLTLQNNRVRADMKISVCTQARRTHFYLVCPPCLRAHRDVRASRLLNITIHYSGK